MFKKILMKGSFLAAFLLLSTITYAQQAEDAAPAPAVDEATLLFNQTTPQPQAVSGMGAGAFLQAILALVFVIALAYGFVFLLRKFSSRTTANSQIINVLTSQTLTSSTSVHVIEIENHLYVIGSGENVNLIAEVTDKEVADSIRIKAEKEEQPSNSFLQILSEKLNKNNMELVKPSRRQFLDEQTKRLKGLTNNDKNKEGEA